jgi:DNA (cytosine-5)-methyltransferase 1
MGYHRAGFEVVGVDIKSQPEYPFEFYRADALEFPLEGFDAIHASPPCQAYSAMTKVNGTQAKHPQLIAAIRNRLIVCGVPYIIENVVGAPLSNPVMLCGTMFGLRLKRHRLFESNFPQVPLQCRHSDSPCDIEIMNRGWKKTRFVPVYGSGGCKAGHLWNEAMGIDWMKRPQLAEAIPPAYTEWIGKELIERVFSFFPTKRADMFAMGTKWLG